MGWRTIGSKRYYQQTYRDVDGRVRSRYIGCGPIAEAIAQADAYERNRRAAEREAARAEARARRERLEEDENPIIIYCENVEGLVLAWMRRSGWHLHHGQWRRTGRLTRREIMSQGTIRYDAAAEAARFRAWLERDNFDAMIEAYDADIARRVVDRIISKLTNDPYQAECLRLKVGRLRHELAGKDPSPIVKVLAERAAVCYLDTYYSDLLAQHDGDVAVRDFLQRRQDRAQRRYLRAIRELAECRQVEAETVRQTAERFQLVG